MVGPDYSRRLLMAAKIPLPVAVTEHESQTTTRGKNNGDTVFWNNVTIAQSVTVRYVTGR
jgi:hypothetical protein